MNLLLMANNGLPRNGLVALFDMGKQIQLGNTGQTLVDFSGRGNNAQLGSTAGADTNDPAFSGQGLTFGTDDYCKSSSPVFDDMAQFTCITVFNANSFGGGLMVGRLFDKTSRLFALRSANNGLFFSQNRAVSADQWTTNTIPIGGNVITGISYENAQADRGPTIYQGNIKQSVTNISAGSGTVYSDAINDLYIGNSPAANRNFDGTIYLQAWYNRILSDTEYMQAYNYLKRLMSSRGITI